MTLIHNYVTTNYHTGHEIEVLDIILQKKKNKQPCERVPFTNTGRCILYIFTSFLVKYYVEL